MADEITQKYLDKLRVRGVPAIIPGTTGMVGSYDCTEIRRQTLRALAVSLGHSYEISDLRNAREKLARLATAQRLRVLEPHLLALNGDPMVDVPHEWEWQLMLPVRGRARAADGVEVSRIHGGMYIETMTPRGFPDLGNLYSYFFGDFLPNRKQQLTRPCIYHRVTDGIESDNPARLSLSVFIPIQLSLKRPLELVNEM